ncbi:hypothetical protein H7K45_20775 [Mycobacterium yunnanensis]|uniref:Uncharacterized protein n=1 Tax=Mycobacterium yunnanensis TaxID=368477 RepID=A0A9X3C3H5_9MYCO|nr:hypothetical protein [Mycobacterium yunnanensis]MCV7422991.1 hypothetical protein [Mycobacterium yunnanensis]
MTVRVADGLQVAYEGVVYRPGETAEVPLHVATVWQINGWVVSDAAGDEEGNGDGKPVK